MKTLQQIGTKLGTEIKQDRDRLSNLESTKVDKIIGKGLSTEDYTTIEKSKLSGIEDGATADMTPSELLTAIKTVDGSGSGLDADLIDGMNAGSTNVGSTVVARDSSGNFSAGTITANLSGNASSATVLAASKTIGMTGDVSWTSTGFDGSTNVSGTATLATVVDSGTGTFKKISTDTKGRVTGTTPVVQTDITELLGANSITNTMVFNIDWSKITTGKPTTIAGFGVSDAYTKTEIDGMLQGLKAKASVIVATTANITLSGTQTIDGVTVTAGQRVLVKNQTTASQNGIYVCSASAWSRSTDADTSTDIMSAYVFVEQGTANKDTAWVMNTDSVVLDTTSLTWVKFAGSGAYAATSHTHSAADITSGTLAVTVGGTGTTSSTGTGSVVLSTSPTLVTPNIGVATGTSFNGITALSSTTPNMDGVASIGTSTTVARADHVHPAQTTITGNAGTATTLQTARTIGASGDVTGTATSFDGSANITIPMTLASVGTAGTYTKVTTDVKGRVISGTTLSASDIPTLNQNTTGSAGSVVNSEIIKFDTGTTEGTDLYTFNGSDAKTINIVAGTGITLDKAAGTVTISNSGMYTLPVATSTALGGVKVSATQQTVVANTVTGTASRTYAVQLDASNNAVVNVPWVDTINPGTVTSVGGTGTVSGLTLSGTVTSTGDLTLGGTLSVTPSNFAFQTANTVLIAPNGMTGTPTFRALVSEDIPVLDWSKITTGKPTTLDGYGISDATPSSHIGTTGASHGVATTSINGFMSSADKTKLDGIATNANNYVHPTSGVVAGTYTKITVDSNGHATAGSTPTTLAGYSIGDAYTKTESDSALALKTNKADTDSINMLRADKFLAAQNIANMIYTNGDLTKIRYNTDTDSNYEVLNYVSGNLSTINHYTGGVLRGTTTLSYTNGNLVSAVFA